MIKKFTILIFALIIPFLVLGPFLSQDWQARAERTFTASIEEIHAVVGNLETWNKWEPWMSYDSDTKFQAGSSTGVGASRKWEASNGNGILVFTEVNPNSGIKYNFEFEGFPPATGSFKYIQEEGVVRVIWIMDGNSDVPLIGGYLAYLVQGTISENLEEGLKSLDKILTENK